MTNKKNKKPLKQPIIDEMTNSIKRDAVLKKDLQLLYMFSMDSIDKEIKAFLKRYEEKGINISELRKRATNEEISELNRRIEKYIQQKELTSGEKLQVDVFNALSKLTRLELLQYHIDLAMLELSDSERELSEKFLNQEYTKGLELSAKTMGIDVLSAGQLALAMNMIVREDFKGQTWSQRLWKNQKALRERVSVIVADSLLRGKNPKGFASAIQKEFNVSRHAVTRLLITEGTRVNANAQVEMMKANGYDYCEVVPEPSACGICKPLANKLIKITEAITGETIPPFHPHCKCGLVASVGEYVESVNKKAYNLSMQSGGIYGAWNDKNDPDEIHRKKHAEQYYESVRKRNTQNEVEKISKNTNFSEKDILIVYNHLFENEYDLENGVKRFDADYDIAQSWDRLFKGKDIQKHDITLINHELMESKLMLKGLSYDEAHKQTEIKYNYLKELIKWKIDRGDW